MPREPGDADDLDFPLERRLMTWLDTHECHRRLVAYVRPTHRVGSGRDEPGQAADGWDLLGEVTEYGFEIAQRVVESPLPFDRVASGVFEETDNGTLIRFRMVFNPGAYAYLRDDRAAIRMLTRLSSARWAAFDADEVAFYLDNFAAILDARPADDADADIGAPRFEESEVGDDAPATLAVEAPAFEAALDDALGVDAGVERGERTYVAVIEPSDDGFAAYVPDLLGCVATGASRPELEENLADAVLLHVNGLLDDGEPLPEPRAETRRVVVRCSARSA